MLLVSACRSSGTGQGDALEPEPAAYRELVVKAVTKTIPMVWTLWERFLYWGGQIVRHGRVIYLDMARGSPEAARFLALWQRMDALGIP
ncbi:MAG: hypothetical protein WHX93_08660 [bacterium]